MQTRTLVLLGAVSLLALVGACANDSEVAPGGHGAVAVAVSPLTLQSVADASWQLTVEESLAGGGWGVVIDRQIDSDGPRGAFSFVGPCVAGESRVTVTLLSVRDPDGQPIDVMIPPPAQKTFTCLENRDVPLDFDITVVSAAKQGFTDITVDYEDVFCSAKIDCSPAYLHDPATGVRGPTVITGLTCTAGPSDTGETTYLGLGQTYMCCANGTHVECTHLGGEPHAGVLDTKRYEGVNSVIGGLYLNTAWRLDEDFLATTGGSCVFSMMGYVNTAPDGQTPDTEYTEGHPAFHWFAEIDAAATCAEAAMDVAYSAIPPNGSADCSPLPDVGPDQPETCNGRDDNCNGAVDEGYVPGVDCTAGVDPDCPCVPPDADGDGVPDAVDSCPNHENPGQGDVDSDSYGDSCDDDMDGDGVTNGLDNCPGVSNPGQQDANFDGTGDACEGLETTCGNGIVELGEQCDQGIFNSDYNSGACRTNCLWGYCGDSVTDPPAEECDDGNQLGGDGCEPTCTLAPLGGSAPPTAPTLFGTTTSGGGAPADPYAGWEGSGFEVAPSGTAALSGAQACVHESAPGQKVDSSLTSPVFDMTGFDTTATLTFTAAVTPSPATGLNPTTSDGTGGAGGGSSSSGFGGSSGTFGAYYGGNGGGSGGAGGGGASTGGSGGTGDGSGGYYSGGTINTGTLTGYTSGNAGVGAGGGGGGGSGAFTGTGYPGSQVTTWIEVTYDGGRTWHVVDAIEGYWEGQQSVRIPLYDPTAQTPVPPGAGFQVRLRCSGTSGDEGFYMGLTSFDVVPTSQNQGPSLSPRPASVTLSRGEVQVIDFQITDPDDQPGPLSYFFQGPDFASFQDLGGGLGRLTLSPSASQAYGWYNARIQYSDGAIVGSHWVNLVLPAPTPPPTRCVKIRTAPNGGGAEVGDLSLVEGQSTTLYAAGYSDVGCTAYTGEVNVYWRHDGGLLEATSTSAFAVYYYTANPNYERYPLSKPLTGAIATEHPDPGVTNDSTGTITLLPTPAGALDPSRSLVAASPGAVPADGASETTLTVTLRDSKYRTVTANHTVAFDPPSSGTLVGAVVHNADGTWSQQLRASTTVGPVTISATVDGQPISATTVVSFTEVRDSSTLPATSDNVISCADVATLAGQDLIVSTTLTVDLDPTQAGCEQQLLYLNSLVVKPGGNLRHQPTPATVGAPERVLNLSVSDLTVEAGGKIDVTGLGYAAARHFGNTTTGAATSAYQAGSHGGLGGRNNASAFTYGDLRDPRWPGGGSYNTAGGGVVRIVVRAGGVAKVDGQILANGNGGAAGGAGGSVRLDAPTLTGAGTISAEGGASTANNNYSGGGGGRVALVGMTRATGNFALDAYADHVSAAGGADYNTSADYAGGAGSVYYETTSGTAQGGVLVFDAKNRTPALGSTPLVALPDGSYTGLSATDITTTVSAAGRDRYVGSSVALTPITTFDGLFDEPVATVTGFGSILLDTDLTAKATPTGTYRGITTVGILRVVNNAKVDAVGDLYVLAGSLDDPNTFDLDGTLQAKRLDLGNANAVVIADQGDLRVSERIIARNQKDFRFPYSVGGGRLTVSYPTMPIGSLDVHTGGALAGTGGVVYGDAIFDTPSFASNPITGVTFLSDLLIKAGSFSATDIAVGGDLSVFGGTFVARYVEVGGDVLFDSGASVQLKGRANAGGDRGIRAGGDIVAQGQTAGGAATTLTHWHPQSSDDPASNSAANVHGYPTALELRAANVRVTAPATIDVSGMGWVFRRGPSSAAGYYTNGSNEGGSHGGRGASSGANNRPDVYDSVVDPVLPGMGGYNSGDDGGGAVIVVASQDIDVATVKANAASGARGGAGGTINLRAGGSVRVPLGGVLEARGGSGSSAYYSGGGGRVAVVAGGSLLGGLASAPRTTVNAAGGWYASNATTSAGAGTIYLADAAQRTLIVDNAGNGGDQTYMKDSTPLPIQGTSLMNAAGSGVLPQTAFTLRDALGTGTMMVGQELLVIEDGVVFTVTGVESGTNAWLLDGDPAAYLGAGHTWCALVDVTHLDVSGNAQLQHDGCVRVAAGNVGDATPTSWDLGGGVNVTRLDLGPATDIAFTGPLARFDVGAQVGAGGAAGYAFNATLDGRLSAQSLLLGNFSVTTSVATLPTVDVAGTATFDGDYTATNVPSAVELEANDVIVTGTIDQTGGLVDVEGIVTVGGDYLQSGGQLALGVLGTVTFEAVSPPGDAGDLDADLVVDGAVTLTNVDVDIADTMKLTGLGGPATYTQTGGALDVNVLLAPGGITLTNVSATLDGRGNVEFSEHDDFNGLVTAGTLALAGTTTLTHRDHSTSYLNDRRAAVLTGAVVELVGGATIDVQGRGFYGTTSNGFAPYATLRAASNSGGSHAGVGGNSALTSRPETFDNLYAPLLGGGGGDSTYANGGGAVRVAATTRATLRAINAAGYTQSTSYGGGAGGAIYVTAPVIEVNGLLDVRGADGGGGYYGGGGGMVSLVGAVTNGVGAAPWDMVALQGGIYSSYRAGSGTLYLRDGATDGDLFVDNAGLAGTQVDSTTLPFKWYSVANTAPTATTYTVNASPRWTPEGYRVSPNVAQPTGAATPALDDDQAFLVDGHGAQTATLPITGGDPTSVWVTGATGCAFYRFDHVNIRGNAQLTVNGCLRIDDGAFGAADPAVFVVAGGLHVDYLDVNQVQAVSTTGPNGRYDVGTQVSHEVAPYPLDMTVDGAVTSDGIVAGNLTFLPGTVATVNGDISVDGDLLATDTTLTADEITVTGTATLHGGASTVDGVTSDGDLRFEGGQVVTVRGQGSGLVSTAADVVFTDAGTTGTHQAIGSAHGEKRELYVEGTDVDVVSGAALDVSGRGYPAGYGPSTSFYAQSGRGGSHGGRGAYSTLTSRAEAYDDLFAPTWPGGGGGSGSGRGGGVLRVVARNDATIDTARANANPTGSNTPTSSSGGAGGAIWVRAVNLLDAVAVQARGADGYTASYAGGGGGRVALYADTFAGALAGAPYGGAGADPADVLDVRGGAVYSGGAAGSGTAFIHSATQYEQGALVIDNRGATTQRDSTPLRGRRGTVSTSDASSITMTSSPGSAEWTYVGQRLTVDTAEGTASLGDNTVFTVTGQTGARLDLDGDPSSLSPNGKTWALLYVFDHLEIAGNAQVDATDALVRVTDGSLVTGLDTDWQVVGAIADQATETEGQSAGLVLDLDTVTDLVLSGPQERFDVPTQVQGVTVAPYWTSVTANGSLELETLKVLAIDAGDITGSISDLRTLEAQNDLVLSGVTVEVTGYGDGLVAGDASTLELQSGVSATHQPHGATGDARRLGLSAGTVRLAAGATLDVIGKGFYYQQGPSTTLRADSTSEAGSHCGIGASSCGSSCSAAQLAQRAPAYDDLFAPTLAGAGGGHSTSPSYGGGVVRIAAVTLADIDGAILASGQGNGSTGGAGGAVYVTADTVDVDPTTGSIVARGGASSTYGGGGGCVALVADVAFTGATLSGATPWTRLEAWGGSTTNWNGGAGTLYLQSSAADDGDLIVDNGETTSGDRTQDDSTPLPGLPVPTTLSASGDDLLTTGASFADLRPSGRRRIRLVTASDTPTLSDETVREVVAINGTTLTLDGAAAPFDGEALQGFYRFDRLEIRGNAHLVTDADLRVDEADFTSPGTDWALHGGLSAPRLDLAAVTDLTIAGVNSRFDVPGDVNDGGADPHWNPSFSGTLRLPALNTTTLAGTVQLRDVASLHVQGDLTLTGSSCHDHRNYQWTEGCGFIDVTGDVTWTGDVGSTPSFELRALRAGQDIALTDTDVELHGDATGLPGGVPDGLSAGRDVTLQGTSFVLRHDPIPAGNGQIYRANVAAGRNLTLADGAVIDVDGRGYRGHNGPSSLHVTDASVGGSHLGLGGASNLASRKPTYDAYWAPAWPGAGGHSNANGGAGGGVVRLHAANALTVAGDIRANGIAGTSNTAGGAGGAIYATSDTTLDLAVTADLSAGGGVGNGGGQYAGGGGGIALVAPTLLGEAVGATPWARMKAYGGLGGYYAGAGTVYVKSAADTWGHLVVDNGDQLTTQLDSTPLVFTGSGLWAGGGVVYDGSSATTLTSTTALFLSSLPPVGFFVNPHVGQPLLPAPTPTLGDDLVYPVTAATATALTVTGDASAVAAAGDAYIPHYRFDTLTVRGNAQLSGDAEIYVRDGHWQDGVASFSVTGGVNVTRLDLNGVTTLGVLGPQGRWEIDQLYGQGSATPRYDVTLSGIVTVNALRTSTFAASDLNLTLLDTMDVLGNMTLTDSVLTGAGHSLVVSGHLALDDSNVTLGSATVGSANILGNAQNITTFAVSGALTATGANLTSTTTTADSVSFDGGVYTITDLTSTHGLTLINSADLTAQEITAESASFDGPQGDVRFRYMDVTQDVTFSGGTRFEETGRDDDGTSPDGLFAGGTVLLTGTGTGGPTAGTHSAHGTTNGERRVLRIDADTVRVDAGAVLDVDGKGYPGRNGVPGYAPDSNALGAQQRHGGSHFGINYLDSYGNRRSYDDVFAPSWAGAGGGQGYYQHRYSCSCGWSCTTYCYSYPTTAGGAGGGVVAVRAATLIDLDGPVQARGLSVTNGPGGAGGAITLDAPVVRLVDGALTVTGGAGYYISAAYNYREQYGGGGGGVAVLAGERVEGVLAGASPWAAVDLRGGLMNGGSSAGSGTFFLEVDGLRSLIVDNGGQSPQADSTPLPFSGGATVSAITSADPVFTMTASSTSTFSKWAPMGYFVNPNVAQSALPSESTYFRITDVNGAVFSLDDDADPVADVGDTWRPFYDLDYLEVRGGARVRVEGQVLVREGSLTPVGTAGTTAIGSPGQIAVNGAFNVPSGTGQVLEVLVPTPDVTITGALTEADPGRWSDGSNAARCDAYLSPPSGYAYAGSTGDGVYTIDPDGAGGDAPFPAYCDMTTDGGGWTKVESATHPFFFGVGNWESLNGPTPTAANYSALAHRFDFAVGGCYSYRFEVGDTADWTGDRAYFTVWQQCHDPFTGSTDGADYTWIAGDEPITCGGFNGLHARYQGHSYASDVDTVDASVGCWWMQVVPHTQYPSSKYLDGYYGQNQQRQWQSLWLRAGDLALDPASFTIVAGDSRELVARGGTPPYAFSVLSVGGGSFAGAVYTAPAATGTHYVRVTDALGATADAVVTITAALAIVPTSVELPKSTSYEFAATGGVPPYTWSILSGGGSFAGATYTAPATEGSAVVRVSDSAGHTADAAVTITTSLFQGSVLMNPTQMAQINSWIGTPGQQWVRCYHKATQGAATTTFHSGCDNKGVSVTVMYLTTGKLIGGYAATSWISTSSGYVSASNSFLFSLTNSFRHNNTNTTYSLYRNASYGPTFGGGHDLFLGNGGTIGNGTYCNLGHSYACRVGSGATCYNDFCGSYNPGISDMEVFVHP